MSFWRFGRPKAGIIEQNLIFFSGFFLLQKYLAQNSHWGRMPLEKIVRESWEIKKSASEYLKITTTEHSRRLINLHIKAASMNFTYEEFLQFFDQLKRIKGTIERKYYDISETTPFGGFSGGQSISPSVVSLNAPETLAVPEIFIITRSGALLFHYDISGKKISRDVDKTMLSALMSAIQLFAENLGWASGITLIQAGDIEIRFGMGDFVIIALVSSIELKLNHVVEPILRDFAKELCTAFEKQFASEFVDDIDHGMVRTGEFDEFKTSFQDILTRYQTETFELYQKLILSEGISLDIPPEICIKIIHLISEGQDMIEEMKNMVESYPLLKMAITRVNYAQFPIWKMFSIPMFEIPVDIR